MHIITETDQTMDLIRRINVEVNRYPYKTDQKLHGQEDFWTARIAEFEAGDCDDYALSKRKRLIEEGIPYTALKPTVCRVEGEGHMVLVVRTDKNDYVLDNIETKVLPVSRLNYEWLFSLNPETGMWDKLY